MQNDIITGQQPAQTDAPKLEQELATLREQHLRLAADFDNFRKRTARESERRAAGQKEALVRELLQVVDNLERALATKPGVDLREGVKMTLDQLIQTLRRHGFTAREDFGQPFDGRYHDALAIGVNRDLPDMAVIEVWERGWMRGAEMFRPAKVLVNQLTEEPVPA